MTDRNGESAETASNPAQPPPTARTWSAWSESAAATPMRNQATHRRAVRPVRVVLGVWVAVLTVNQ